jgi:energy-coupling factor transport system substrate-specific component
VLIPIAIAINVVLGQTVGTALKLPIYLDSIGTILVGVLAGPIAGAATGLLSNLAWTFLLAGTPFGSPFAWPFAIVAIEIGLLAGVFG